MLVAFRCAWAARSLDARVLLKVECSPWTRSFRCFLNLSLNIVTDGDTVWGHVEYGSEGHPVGSSDRLKLGPKGPESLCSCAFLSLELEGSQALSRHGCSLSVLGLLRLPIVVFVSYCFSPRRAQTMCCKVIRVMEVPFSCRLHRCLSAS